MSFRERSEPEKDNRGGRPLTRKLNVSLRPATLYVTEYKYMSAHRTQGSHSKTSHRAIMIPSTGSTSLTPTYISPLEPRPTDRPMSQSTAPKVTANSTSRPPKREGERPGKPQDLPAPTPKPTRKPEKETGDGRGDVAGSEDLENLRKLLDEERGISKRLRWEKGKLNGECKTKDDRIMELEETITMMRGTMAGQTQQIRMVEERLKQTEELLVARTAELHTTQTFLSPTDNLSEAEVLSIVHDLNEVIYQVAVKLTEEWEKLESAKPTAKRMEIDRTTRPRISPLLQLVRDQNPAGLIFQLQSCLCSQIVSMTSGRRQFQGLAVLESVYKRLSASGKHHAADAG